MRAETKLETFAKPPDVDAVQGVAAQGAQTYHIDRQASEQRTTQKCAADGSFAKVSDGKFHLGYKQHTRTDADGYIEKIHLTPANAHEVKHLAPLLDGVKEGTMVYADKGYASQDNRQCLQDRALKDGIMEKAYRGHPLSAAQKMRNGCLARVRYVVEQSFGTLHRKFRYARASYSGST